MIDINKKYRYRNGEEARILCVDLIGRGLHCVVSCDNVGNLFTQTINGNYMLGRGEHDYDLIEVKEKKVLWLNVYPDLEDVYAHESMESADGDPKKDRVARIKVCYEEGQFDD